MKKADEEESSFRAIGQKKETEFRPLHLVMDEWYPFVLQEPAG